MLAESIGTTVELVPGGCGIFGVVFLATLKKNKGVYEMATVTHARIIELKSLGRQYEEGWFEFLKRSLVGPQPGSRDAVLERRRVELSTGVLYNGIGARV